MTDRQSIGEDMLKVLRSIDAKLGQLVRQSGAASIDVADDQDLDGKYGDPKVNFNPRDWRGDSIKGARYSECPAEFLDLLASALDYFARKADENGETASNGKPKSFYSKKDAARARGWAKRIRAGYVNTSTGEIVDGSTNTMPASTFDESEWPAEPVSELTDADIHF
jgi:hypothetical protein